jgi:hypothetical protein
MTLTKGGIVIEDIEIGDIHYEYGYSSYIECEVLTKPELIDGAFHWNSKNVLTGEIINYIITPVFSHYGPNLYDYEEYFGFKQI